MPARNRNRNYDEIKRCLAEADRAFARAGVVDDEHERMTLIEEAETWLVLAEGALARIVDRQAPTARPHSVPVEDRSFGDAARAEHGLVWRRRPHA
jgi:hypothetical protein